VRTLALANDYIGKPTVSWSTSRTGLCYKQSATGL